MTDRQRRFTAEEMDEMAATGGTSGIDPSSPDAMYACDAMLRQAAQTERDIERLRADLARVTERERVFREAMVAIAADALLGQKTFTLAMRAMNKIHQRATAVLAATPPKEMFEGCNNLEKDEPAPQAVPDYFIATVNRELAQRPKSYPWRTVRAMLKDAGLWREVPAPSEANHIERKAKR